MSQIALDALFASACLSLCPSRFASIYDRRFFDAAVRQTAKIASMWMWMWVWMCESSECTALNQKRKKRRGWGGKKMKRMPIQHHSNSCSDSGGCFLFDYRRRRRRRRRRRCCCCCCCCCCCRRRRWQPIPGFSVSSTWLHFLPIFPLSSLLLSIPPSIPSSIESIPLAPNAICFPSLPSLHLHHPTISDPAR